MRCTVNSWPSLGTQDASYQPPYITLAQPHPPPHLPHRPFYIYLVLGVEQRKEMTDTIKADLERLFPTGCGDHFLVPARQELLLSVLSLWADLHPATGYRQGMHEVRGKGNPGYCIVNGRECL